LRRVRKSGQVGSRGGVTEYAFVSGGYEKARVKKKNRATPEKKEKLLEIYYRPAALVWQSDG